MLLRLLQRFFHERMVGSLRVWWKWFTLILLLLPVMVAAGCAGKAPAAVEGGDRFVIARSGQADIDITVESLKQLPPVSRQVEAVRRGGETARHTVKGALLADVLSGIGKNQADLYAVRLEAGDGYSIEVPREILQTREVILAYEIDGKPLEKELRPVRVIIPEVRAMYWVKNLLRMEILTPEHVAAVTELVLIESAVQALDHVEYLYDGSVDLAVKAPELVNWTLPGERPVVRFLALDGLDKNETWENFAKGKIKWSGKDAPAFVSEELPRGMHIKEVLWFAAGHKGFASAAMAQKKFDTVVMRGDIKGIALPDLLESIGFRRDTSLRLTALDGNTMEIGRGDIPGGVLYLSADGKPALAFRDAGQGAAVKGLLKLEAIE